MSRGTRTTVRAAVLAALLVLTTAALSACAPLLGLIPDPVPEPATDFASYGEQEIAWGDCDFGSELECAWVYAPLDWAAVDGAREDGETGAQRDGDIRLRLVKHPAEGDERLGTLFVNPGGPGASGVDYITYSYANAVQPAVLAHYDVIGWDPRGVGQSSAVRCLDDSGLDDFLYGVGDPVEDGATLEFGSDAWIEVGVEATEEFGRACLDETGELLGHIDTGSTVRDLDMLRQLVGDERLNYLGYSYGTMIGALYADMFPDRVGRLVLDGAVDPTTSLVEAARAQATGIETALRDYIADCPSRETCPLTGSVDQGFDRIDGLLKRYEQHPIRADDGRMLYDSTFFTAIVAALYSPELWGHLDRVLADAAAGEPDAAFALADYYNDRVDGVYQSNLIEAFLAINCLDYPREPLDFDAMRAEAAETIRLAPLAGRFQSFGEISCAKWPVPAVDVSHPVTGAGADPILVIGTTGDPATPFHWAESLAAQLESAALISFDGDGHTAYGKSACVNAIVDEYLLVGVVPQPSARAC